MDSFVTSCDTSAGSPAPGAVPEPVAVEYRAAAVFVTSAPHDSAALKLRATDALSVFSQSGIRGTARIGGCHVVRCSAARHWRYSPKPSRAERALHGGVDLLGRNEHLARCFTPRCGLGTRAGVRRRRLIGAALPARGRGAPQFVRPPSARRARSSASLHLDFDPTVARPAASGLVARRATGAAMPRRYAVAVALDSGRVLA